MFKLKNTAVAVLALGSSAVFAGTMGPVCSPGNVTVPCERSAWDFAGQALYLQPSLGGYNFSGIKETTTATSSYRQSQNIASSWNWGFYLEGSYHFSTGNDLDLNWYHMNNKHTRYSPEINAYDLRGDLSGNVKGTVNPKWDAVNLELGQHVDFSQASSARFHGGISYVRTDNTSTLTSPTIADTIDDYSSVNWKSTYNGFGPRAGADLWYGFGNGFALYAKPAASLYAGTRGARSSSVRYDGFTNTSSASSMKVVPELEARIGGTFTYAMAQGDLSLDVGWLWINYFDSTARVNDFGAQDTYDFGMQGLYFGLKWIGNVV